MCKRVYIVAPFLICAAACSRPVAVASNPFDYSDRVFKKNLDASYMPASTLQEIENAVGKAPERLTRAQITAGGDLELQEAMRRVDALGPIKVDVVLIYVSMVSSATWCRDVLFFGSDGKLLWSYRFKLG